LKLSNIAAERDFFIQRKLELSACIVFSSDDVAIYVPVESWLSHVAANTHSKKSVLSNNIDIIFCFLFIIFYI